jgi:hypothetical protein
MASEIISAVPITEASEITPISRKPIEKVNASEWKEFSEHELFDQLEILTNRRNMAYSIQKPGIAAEIQKGIDRLTKILNNIEANKSE